MKPYDELADELTKRLHDPGAYVDRGPGDRPSKQEPLKLWQVRALMTYFEEVQKREVGGKFTILARSAFREKNENDE